MHFVGIDLAWSPRNRSGGVVLSADGILLSATAALGDDREVVDFVTNAIPEGAPGLAAIDAPLAVPNDSGGRTCDRQVAAVFGRFEAGPYPANRRTLARYGGLRGEAIAGRLRRLGFHHDPQLERQAPSRRVIEVFPHPATVSLFDLELTLKYKARKGRDYALRWQELGRLRDLLVGLAESNPPLRLTPEVAGMEIEGRQGKALKEVEDLLDAVVCAYSVLYAWHRGPRGYAVYGGPSQVGQSARVWDEVGHILVPMTPSMWQRIKSPRLLFLDRDGTLNEGFGRRPPNQPSEVRLLPGVGVRLRHYAAMGWRLIVITNQGGVAYGYMSEAQSHAVQQTILDALPVPVDASYLCPHHPQGTVTEFAVDCPNRKPAPGAILQTLARFGARPDDCLLVGDQESDHAAADAAGVPFVWADSFFGPDAKAIPTPEHIPVFPDRDGKQASLK